VLPQWVVVGVTVAVAVLLGRYIEPRPRWIEGATVVMATTFALGLAFPNYWFLIMGLMAMSLTMSTRAESDLNVTGQAVEA
jgi:chromate transport protein ChrA